MVSDCENLELNSIILCDARASVGGGQTVFLQLVSLAIRNFKNVSVAIPLGGGGARGADKSSI